jgi:hypothetical protein
VEEATSPQTPLGRVVAVDRRAGALTSSEEGVAATSRRKPRPMNWEVELTPCHCRGTPHCQGPRSPTGKVPRCRGEGVSRPPMVRKEYVDGLKPC